MKLVDIQIREFGDIELLDPESHEIGFKDICILKTDYGMDYGRVLSKTKVSNRVQENAIGLKIMRKATPSDLEQIAQNRIRVKEALEICRNTVNHHKLPMRVLAGEFSFDRHKLVFYFTAPGRIDFRNLLPDLAASFKTRIDLRQIGARNEAKIIGGIAPCGKTQVCCTQFMKSFDTITTKMAKVQKLPVHQDKLLGLCGQLKCCLKFELDTYEELSKNLPKEGTRVSTKAGRGYILAQNILRQSLTIRLEDDRQMDFPLNEIHVLREG
jgi:cell fate regulator YaaT (PSP1 superfamily)